MTAPVDVLAEKWVAELAVSPNGMHEIRAGHTNERERPLIGYAASYQIAKRIADDHYNSAAVAELVAADRELDEIRLLPAQPEPVADYHVRLSAAWARRAAALARFGGAA